MMGMPARSGVRCRKGAVSIPAVDHLGSRQSERPTGSWLGRAGAGRRHTRCRQGRRVRRRRKRTGRFDDADADHLVGV